MTVKVFWENPYQTELVSTVSWIEGRNIRPVSYTHLTLPTSG